MSRITIGKGELMSQNAIRWSGLPLIAGAVLLGAANVLTSLTPVANQAFSPLVSSSPSCFRLSPGSWGRRAPPF
jgi:hypothetical protein